MRAGMPAVQGRRNTLFVTNLPPVPAYDGGSPRRNAMQLKDPDLFRQQAAVGGTWCDADDGRTIEVRNPATGKTVGSVPLMGGAETRRAIAAAEVTQAEWRKRTAKERAAILR